MKAEWSNLVLIVAPRNPGRAQGICRDLKTTGLSIICTTELESEAERSNKHDVILVDTIGVLSRLYAVADVAFVGGSLVNSGGHNPLEPAAYCKPILFGPDMSDFKEISKNLLESKGAIQVRDSDSLHYHVMRLLKDPSSAAEMGKSAYELLRANRGAVERTFRVIEEVFQ
jgi:3-deoxy-D-manno-octulosonic-acid transferase